MLLIKLHQSFYVNCMKSVNVILCWINIFLNCNWRPNNHCERSSVGNNAKIVVENSSSVEYHRCEPKDTVYLVLKLPNKRSLWVRNL